MACFFQLHSHRGSSGASFQLLGDVLGSSSRGWRGMHTYHSYRQYLDLKGLSLSKHFSKLLTLALHISDGIYMVSVAFLCRLR